MGDERDPIGLAERVLGILSEGSFSATYKFALFIAILDLCIENTSTKGLTPTSLTTRELAQKVVELYWPQVAPYPGVGVLRFGGGMGEQAEIVSRILHLRERLGSDVVASYQAEQVDRAAFDNLVRFVEWKLIEMPIPRLQVLGGHEHRFLYTYNWTTAVKRSTVTAYQHRRRGGNFDNRLNLLPGVGENLVRLNGIIRPLFHREWAVMVARLNSLPEAQLERFLFGCERIPLDTVRQPLSELQNHRCFYCEERLTVRPDVDHFIPWSRFPENGLDNLVVAHPKCNNSKRDFLAAAPHVQHWVTRMRELDGELARVAQEKRWRRDSERTLSVARSIYLMLAPGARLWLRPSAFVPATGLASVLCESE